MVISGLDSVLLQECQPFLRNCCFSPVLSLVWSCDRVILLALGGCRSAAPSRDELTLPGLGSSPTRVLVFMNNMLLPRF